MIEIKYEKENNKSVAYDSDIKIGECVYIDTEEYWNIIHTEVNSIYKGQGIGKRLVESIIKNAKGYNKKVIAECSYAKKILEAKT